jgi:hypothetical protein
MMNAMTAPRRILAILVINPETHFISRSPELEIRLEIDMSSRAGTIARAFRNMGRRA